MLGPVSKILVSDIHTCTVTTITLTTYIIKKNYIPPEVSSEIDGEEH